MVDNTDDFELYRYDPSIAAAILFVILFSTCAGFHSWKIFQRRVLYFIPLLVGALFEIVGYIGRAKSNSDPKALTPYIIQALLILLAPALFAASIYMVLGRTIVLLGAEHHSLVRVNWLTKVFVGGDVLSFLVQCGGGGLMAGGSLSDVNLGETLIEAGLGLQLASFGLFVVVAGIFHFRIARRPTAVSTSMDQAAESDLSKKSWRTVMWTLYLVSLLILIRSIFRLIEYAGGNAGYLISHEVFLYVFDAFLMLGVLVVLIFFHPSEVVPGRKIAESHVELQ